MYSASYNPNSTTAPATVYLSPDLDQISVAGHLTVQLMSDGAYTALVDNEGEATGAWASQPAGVVDVAAGTTRAWKWMNGDQIAVRIAPA